MQIWCETYAAQICAVAILGPWKKWRWHSHDKAEGRFGITCQCDMLTEIMEHRLTEEESEWQIPDPFARECRQFVETVQ